MAYVTKGNLYFQDGSKPPIQLTSSGEDSTPVFSDDGEKLVFYRGLVPHDLYTINPDGTQERALVTGDLLATLDSGYDKYTEMISLAYVPGTHQILFNTRQLGQGDIDEKDINRLGSKANLDLLLVNVDTGEIKRLLPKGTGGGFFISPDGSMVAVQAKGHIDVISIDGRVIRHSLITYTPTHPYGLAPNISWKSDSTELIVSLPARDIFDMSGPEAFTIWRYAVDGSTKAQLPFDPPPLDSCCASPDGTWFLYPYYYYPGKTSDQIPHGIYLGNLHGGNVQLYDPNYLSYHWSPDSIHFIFGANGLFLGAINEQPKYIDQGQFLGWLDNNRFLYYGFASGMLWIGDTGKASIPIATSIPRDLTIQGASAFTFIYRDRGMPTESPGTRTARQESIQLH
jgi:Tol biopolymer transport system component